MENERIVVRYSTIDRYGKTWRYSTRKGAAKKVRELLGKHFDIGSNYAVSGDGIGKVVLDGATFAELFEEPREAVTLDQNPEEWIGYALESYGETLSQHHAETAQFGDSWPGAQVELRERREAIVAYALKHKLPNPFAPQPRPAPAPAHVVSDSEDDCPF
jgi:hypothetical protein